MEPIYIKCLLLPQLKISKRNKTIIFLAVKTTKDSVDAINIEGFVICLISH